MDSETERVMRNLSILGSVSQNDKINTNGDIFIIYVPTVMRGMMRLWYGEARQCNIQRLQETVRMATNAIRQYVTDIQQMTGDDQRFQKATKELWCKRLIRTLADSRNGLNNLQQTYRDDVTMHTQVKMLIDEVTDFLQIIQTSSEANSFVLNGGLLQS